MANQYYKQRINAAIDYIEKNLTEKISLDDLAENALFSKFHFHRIFKSVTGESLINFTRRLKMEKALKLLRIHQKGKVKEVAFQLGYQSLANFSRDFKQYYGVSPSAHGKIPIQPDRNPLISNKQIMLEFQEIRHLPSFYVLYKRILTGYDPDAISKEFGLLYQFALSNNLLDDIAQSIGIGYDDPDFTPIDKCRYDACLVVDPQKSINIGDQFNTKYTEQGKYAIFYFEGKKEAFFPAWDVVFKEWLINSDYLPDNRPHFEMYLPSDTFEQGIFKANLCLPVKPIEK